MAELTTNDYLTRLAELREKQRQHRELETAIMEGLLKADQDRVVLMGSPSLTEEDRIRISEATIDFVTDTLKDSITATMTRNEKLRALRAQTLPAAGNTGGAFPRLA